MSFTPIDWFLLGFCYIQTKSDEWWMIFVCNISLSIIIYNSSF